MSKLQGKAYPPYDRSLPTQGRKTQEVEPGDTSLNVELHLEGKATVKLEAFEGERLGGAERTQPKLSAINTAKTLGSLTNLPDLPWIDRLGPSPKGDVLPAAA